MASISEPEYADFWIIHSHSPPYRTPVQLTDAINIHENDHVQIEGRNLENMPTGYGYFLQLSSLAHEES